MAPSAVQDDGRVPGVQLLSRPVFQTGYYALGSSTKNDHVGHTAPVGGDRAWPRKFMARELDDAWTLISSSATDTVLANLFKLAGYEQVKAPRLAATERVQAAEAAGVQRAGITVKKGKKKKRKLGGKKNSMVDSAHVLRDYELAVTITMAYRTESGVAVDYNCLVPLVSLHVHGNEYDITELYITGRVPPWSYADAVVHASGAPPYDDNFRKKDSRVWETGVLHLVALVWATAGEVRRAVPCMEYADCDCTHCTSTTGDKLFHLTQIDAENHLVTALHGYLPREQKPAIKFFLVFSRRLCYGVATNGAKLTLTDGDSTEITVVEESKGELGGADDHKRKRCTWHTTGKTFAVVYSRDQNFDGGVGKTLKDGVEIIIAYSETPAEVNARFKELTDWLVPVKPRPSDSRSTNAQFEIAKARPTALSGTSARLTPESVDPTKLTVAELKVRLEQRGLPVIGKRAVLVDRLLAADGVSEEPDWAVEQFVYRLGAGCVRVKLFGIDHQCDRAMNLASFAGHMPQLDFDSLVKEMDSSKRTPDTAGLPPLPVNAGVFASPNGGDHLIERLVYILDGIARVRWLDCDWTVDTYESTQSLKESLGADAFGAFALEYASRTPGVVAQDAALKPPPLFDTITGDETDGLTLVRRRVLQSWLAQCWADAPWTCAGYYSQVRDLFKISTPAIAK